MITKQQLDLAKTTLGLNTLEGGESDSIINKLGHDILEIAVGKFLEQHGEWEQTSFENWIETNKKNPNMLEELIVLYPEFGKILTEEILMLKEQMEKTSIKV